MASSDLLNTHPLGIQSDAEDLGDASTDQVPDDSPDKRVTLPKPDTNNITVLTESLPNEPILPWHHFDSPWLEKDETETSNEANNSTSPADISEVANLIEEQLTLPLEIARHQSSNAPEASDLAQSSAL